MRFVPSFYCVGLNHNGKLVRFDDNLRKPVSGTCGHSVCLQCQNDNPHMNCPENCAQKDVFLGQEPNYQAMEMTVKCRDNFLELLRIWWRGERFGTGACSSCSTRSTSLKLCLDCHSDLYHKDQESSGFILNIRNFLDLMELSEEVLCSDCAISHHKGHQIEKLEDFNFDKRNIKTISAKEILALFREKLEQKRNQIDCKLRRMRLEYVESQISELLKRKFKGEDPQNLRESIKLALVGLHIEHLIMKTEELIDESSGVCECSRIYRKLAGNARNFDFDKLNRIYSDMAYYRIERFSMGCPFYFKSRNQKRRRLYRMAQEEPQKIFTDYVPKSPCSLCVSLNENEETRVRKILNDYVRDYRNNETVDLTLPRSLCLRCLNILDQNFE